MKAFVPSHITGFFAAKRNSDPMRSGSIGAGLALSMGGVTVAEKADITEIFLNGQLCEAPVSRYVIDRLAGSPVKVKTNLYMPLGSGFGASAAGALGCAYALNSLFDLGLTANQAAAVAHEAEVANGTGLGDVIAQNTGGLVIRLRAGAPGTGKIDRIPTLPLKIDCVVQGPISTREVLSDPRIMRDINNSGKSAIKELLVRPTLSEFMRLSRQFTSQIGLASSWAMDAIEAVQASGGMASMIMLGDAVFSIGAPEALAEFGPVISTDISQRGASLD
jgi:pantoate kinase